MTSAPPSRVVGVGELVVSAVADDELVTYALGSCLGVAVHDGEAGVAGLLHAMLPESTINPQDARRHPARYIDTGVPALFHACYHFGARKDRMTVTVVGGAFAVAEPDGDHFQIGKRNLVALRRLLWKNGVLIRAEETGGQQASRTVFLQVATGRVRVRANGAEHPL